jgi:prepilin-type N-terminal cleavage/methylation domain-containing protein
MKGFTLVETLIVVAITVVLSAIAVAYNRSSEEQITLYRDQAVVIGLLNRSKSFAFQKYRDPSIPDYLTCAFGLHFEPDSRDFIFFQDLGEGSCDPANANYRYDEGADPSEALETFSLDPRLEFEGIPAGDLDIFFIPPEVNASSSTDLPVSVVIKTVGGGLKATTTVASSGQIITE